MSVPDASWDNGPRDIIADLKAISEYAERNKGTLYYDPDWWKGLSPNVIVALARGLWRGNGEPVEVDFVDFAEFLEGEQNQ